MIEVKTMKENYKKISYSGDVFVFKNLISESESRFIHDCCLNYAKKNPEVLINANNGKVINMLFDEIPSLKSMFESKKILEVLSEVIGCNEDELVISRHSDYHVNTLGGWHNDLEGGDYCSHDEAKKAGIYKFGIFFAEEPYLDKIGTQFKISNKKFRPRLSKNDILIFPVGITHRGYPGRFFLQCARKIFRILKIKNDNFSFLRSFLGEPNRSAVFFTFGRNCNEFQKFESGNIRRAISQKGIS